MTVLEILAARQCNGWVTGDTGLPGIYDKYLLKTSQAHVLHSDMQAVNVRQAQAGRDNGGSLGIRFKENLKESIHHFQCLNPHLICPSDIPRIM